MYICKAFHYNSLSWRLYKFILVPLCIVLVHVHSVLVMVKEFYYYFFCPIIGYLDMKMLCNFFIAICLEH